LHAYYSRAGKQDNAPEIKKFSWFEVFHRMAFGYKKNFYFWWQLANYLHTQPSERKRKWARRINYGLLRK
jgi:hypothetical protein